MRHYWILKPALAHVFLSDKNALLLAIVNQLKTELELISYNLDHSDNNLALKHLADAAEIQTRNNNISSFSIPYLDELSQLIESIPVDSEQTESLLRINETIDNASRILGQQDCLKYRCPRPKKFYNTSSEYC